MLYQAQVRFVAFTFMALLVSVSCSRKTIKGDFYATYADANRAQIFDVGMAPNFLPSDIRDINYYCNINDREVRMNFSFPKGSLLQTPEKIPTITKLSRRISPPSSFDEPPWFKLKDDKNAKCYECPGDFGKKGYLIINFKERNALFWIR